MYAVTMCAIGAERDFNASLPCCTAVQVGLLYIFLVEIEMWAAKKNNT